MKTTLELKNQAKKVYYKKGLNALKFFLKKEGVKFEQKIEDFGLHTSKKANKDKWDFIENEGENEIRTHYYSITAGKCKTTGFSYNKLRASVITIK